MKLFLTIFCCFLHLSSFEKGRNKGKDDGKHIEGENDRLQKWNQKSLAIFHMQNSSHNINSVYCYT